MIKSIHIENLKGFHNYDVEFSRISLLVGGNNCGKTTIFQGLAVFFWSLLQTVDLDDRKATFRKTQVPEIGAIPYFNAKDLFHQQKVRSAKKPTRITVALRTSVAPDLKFSIYPAFSRNLMVDGGGQSITLGQYNDLLQLNPVYVPGTIGITVREELYREVAQERMILEGRQNQVLRNLVYRLKKKKSEWDEFVKMVRPLFSLGALDVPFDENRDEWLTATYEEGTCHYDLMSGGSGFLQVINLLSFLLLHTSRVALLKRGFAPPPQGPPPVGALRAPPSRLAPVAGTRHGPAVGGGLWPVSALNMDNDVAGGPGIGSTRWPGGTQTPCFEPQIDRVPGPLP